MESRTPEIALVIASYQRAKPLHDLLERLVRQTLDRARWEVIVAVDGSTDESMQVLAAWQARGVLPLRYFRQENAGQSVARHCAMVMTQAARIIVIDDDMELADGFMAAHLAAAAPNPEQTVVIGRVIPQEAWQSMPLYESVREAFMAGLHARLGGGTEVPSATSFITQNVGVPRAMYLSVGGFDPQLRLDEDRELGIRLELAGGRFVFAPEAAAVHRSAIGSYAKWRQRQYDYGRYALVVWRKHGEDALLHPLRNFVAGSRWNRRLVLVCVPWGRVARVVTAVLRFAGETLRALGGLRFGLATHKAIIALQYHLGLKDALGGWQALRAAERRLLADPRCPREPTGRGATRSAREQSPNQ